MEHFHGMYIQFSFWNENSAQLNRISCKRTQVNDHDKAAFVCLCAHSMSYWFHLQKVDAALLSENTLGPRLDGRRFPDDIFKWIFVNEIIWIPNKISLKFVPWGPINNIPALVQIMTWRRPGGKPLSEAMMVSLLTHVCVTRPQWVKWYRRISHKCD